MKKSFNIVSIFIFTLLFSFNINAKNKAKKSKIDIYLKSYELYQNDSFELAIKYSTESIKSKKKSDCIACYLTRATCNYVLNNFQAAKNDFEYINKIDKKHSFLLKISECNIRLGLLNTLNNDLNFIAKTSKSVYERAISYAYLKNIDSVTSYIKTLDSILIKAHKDQNISTTQNNIEDNNIYIRKFILYNILNKKELALQNLDLALKDNYKHFRYLEICNDFSEIRKDERFNTLIKKYKELQQSNKS